MNAAARGEAVTSYSGGARIVQGQGAIAWPEEAKTLQAPEVLQLGKASGARRECRVTWVKVVFRPSHSRQSPSCPCPSRLLFMPPCSWSTIRLDAHDEVAKIHVQTPRIVLFSNATLASSGLAFSSLFVLLFLLFFYSTVVYWFTFSPTCTFYLLCLALARD